ncbi:MAG: acetate kinase [Candidatus Tectomicrobia bacterium]|nr:acetate kinase [Candidatus Tectomicrobia bacterium]
MTRYIAVVNTGASTLKLALMEVGLDGVWQRQRFEYDWHPSEHAGDLLRTALESLEATPDAIGHRVVHGGAELVEPTTLTPQLETELEALVPLAPLHNGPAVAAIREVRKIYPRLPAVAVFDTTFHAYRPPASMRYALRQDTVDAFAIRRYGFHGIAHASLVDGLADAEGIPIDEVSAVTLQLGAGCSACAVQHGRSIETSMGFTPLEGLVMATRSGDVDPAIVLRLMRAGYDADRIEDELTRRAGLLALCGLTDMREILAAESRGQANARLALDLFCHRIVLMVGGYLTLLGGEGALVFGGGIGTNAPRIRERVAQGLSAWGVMLDPVLNQRNQPGRLSTNSSRPVFALRTEEEHVIAREVDRHLG